MQLTVLVAKDSISHDSLVGTVGEYENGCPALAEVAVIQNELTLVENNGLNIK